MADHITVQVMDRATAAAVQGELQSYGLHIRRSEPSRTLSFGSRIAFGPVQVDVASIEILEIVEGIGPALINGVFNTLERFRDRVRLFINGQPVEIPERHTATGRTYIDTWLEMHKNR